MNKNNENYKNALNQIHASEELKQKTFENIKNKKDKNNKIIIKHIISIAAVFTICFIGINQYEKIKVEKIECPIESPVKIANTQLPHFESMEELRAILAQNNMKRNKEIAITDSVAILEMNSTKSVEQATTNNDYSTTNVQVENVDEADIVKNDGEYIYYITNNNIYIVKANEMQIVSKIEYNDLRDKIFTPREIYVKDKKLIVLGNYSEYEKQSNSINEENIKSDYIDIKTTVAAKVIIYDISDIKNPVIIRQAALDGFYNNSRMIDDNLYFISSKPIYYYEEAKNEEILPYIYDTIMPKEKNMISYTDIVYIRGGNSYNYMLVGGLNINNNEKINVETFFGASDIVYASENNLYITQTVYDSDYVMGKTEIYKFNLLNSQIMLQAKCEVDGILKNQFSMDEYDGNLRLAITVTNITKPSEETIHDVNGKAIISRTIPETQTENKLIILDKELKEIGKIEDLAIEEEIYAVRFIGEIGYVVTFKEIDPLFVIDLSDPNNPKVKGELKIPGYSSYLHPYDENHIIGIGYNTEENQYGRIVNTNMKVSMFDVSDLENPKEMYTINVGEKFISSELMYNHKVLFSNKNRNLIGFPYTYRGNRVQDDENGLILLKVDLENGFEEYGKISNKINGLTNIKRAIYINDILYTISNTRIISYDLITIEKLKELILE